MGVDHGTHQFESFPRILVSLGDVSVSAPDTNRLFTAQKSGVIEVFFEREAGIVALVISIGGHRNSHYASQFRHAFQHHQVNSEYDDIESNSLFERPSD